jgi:hypothetical protein
MEEEKGGELTWRRGEMEERGVEMRKDEGQRSIS